MSKYLEQVAEFMVTFDQEVNIEPTKISKDINKLRIALIFEELREYAEASGLIYEFEDMLEKRLADSHNMTQVHPHPTSVNQVEQLDALLDLQYVLSGAVHAHGFGKIFDAAFNEVHSSNMSKACDTLEEVIDTKDQYSEVVSTCDTTRRPLVVKRKEDGKVLKSINYRPAELTQFLK